MENYKICSFFGHRAIEITEELKEGLARKIRELIEKEGYGIFCFGGFGEFDDLAWQTVTKLKEEYPYIKRIFYLYDPRHENPKKRPKNLRDCDFEEFIYPALQFDWWYKRIYYRNVEIIDQSDYVIFYVKNTENSGAYKAYRYALKAKKAICNMA